MFNRRCITFVLFQEFHKQCSHFILLSNMQRTKSLRKVYNKHRTQRHLIRACSSENEVSTNASLEEENCLQKGQDSTKCHRKKHGSSSAAVTPKSFPPKTWVGRKSWQKSRCHVFHLWEADVIASLCEHIWICPSPGIEVADHRLKLWVKILPFQDQ